jgi:hypothetical protein
MAQEMILDAFTDLIDNHEVLSDILYIVFEHCTKFVKDKKKAVIDGLVAEMNLKECGSEQVG